MAAVFGRWLHKLRSKGIAGPSERASCNRAAPRCCPRPPPARSLSGLPRCLRTTLPKVATLSARQPSLRSGVATRTAWQLRPFREGLARGPRANPAPQPPPRGRCTVRSHSGVAARRYSTGLFLPVGGVQHQYRHRHPGEREGRLGEGRNDGPRAAPGPCGGGGRARKRACVVWLRVGQL